MKENNPSIIALKFMKAESNSTEEVKKTCERLMKLARTKSHTYELTEIFEQRSDYWKEKGDLELSNIYNEYRQQTATKHCCILIASMVMKRS